MRRKGEGGRKKENRTGTSWAEGRRSRLIRRDREDPSRGKGPSQNKKLGLSISRQKQLTRVDVVTREGRKEYLGNDMEASGGRQEETSKVGEKTV